MVRSCSLIVWPRRPMRRCRWLLGWKSSHRLHHLDLLKSCLDKLLEGRDRSWNVSHCIQVLTKDNGNGNRNRNDRDNLHPCRAAGTFAG